MNDFDKTDKEVNAISNRQYDTTGDVPVAANGLVKFRNQLIQQYHRGAPSLLERLKVEGMNSAEALVMELVKEIANETDNLLGNGLVALHNGELRDSTVMSSKRVDALQAAIKATQTKQAMDKDGVAGVDVYSPSMQVVFRFFVDKLKVTFKKLNIDQELSDMVFKTLKDVLQNWRKELQRELDENSGVVDSEEVDGEREVSQGVKETEDGE